MIEEQYVSLETAKLLRKKGFNEPCRAVYYEFSSGDIEFNDRLYNFTYNNHTASNCFLAPTQEVVKRWLRELYGLHISVCPAVEGYYHCGRYRAYIEKIKERYPFSWYIGDYDSYEEASEAAIKESLLEYALESITG